MKRHLSKYVILFHLVLLTIGPWTVLGRSFVYPSENSISPCIFLDINFNITFTAFNNTKVVAYRALTQNDVVRVSGNCVHAAITLSFTNRTNWSFQFRQDSNGDVHLKRTVYFIPSDVFRSRVSDTDVVAVKDGRTTNLLKPPFLYQCDKPEVTQYTNKSISQKSLRYTIQVNVFKIHIQGFNIHSGDVSTSIRCVSDNSTTVPPSLKIVATSLNIQTNILRATNETSEVITSTSQNTTSAASPTNETPSTASTTTAATDKTTITTTPQPKAPTNNYIVSDNNMHCILLQGAFTINIDYLQNSSSSEEVTTKTASVDIPANATGTGNCNETANSQILVISFLDDWSLKIVFTLDEGKTSIAQASSQMKYGITNLTLIYVTNATFFPGSKDSPEINTVFPQNSKDTDYPKKSSNYDYYKCNSNIKMQIQSGVTLHARELLFKAFNTNNDTGFPGQADECAADEETSQTVPIAVACTLGGLAILVAIFYSICKLRKGG